MRFAVTFPAQTIEVEAADPQEAACAAAYELARQCEQGTLAQVALELPFAAETALAP